MNFGQRLTEAMEGKFPTDNSLAERLTELLRSQGRLAADKEIPEQTIQSARERITEGGLSKYTLDFAYLCEVSPYWLAFEVGPKRVKSGESLFPADAMSRRMAEIWASLDAGKRRRIADFTAGIVSEAPDQITKAPAAKRKRSPFKSAGADQLERKRRAS